MDQTGTVLFWHRRDLRLTDNAGLYKALKSGFAVQPVFIFDSTILQQLPENDQRVLFIYRKIEALKAAYAELGADLEVVYGDPKEAIPQLADKHTATTVFTNRDYEPAAIERDKHVYTALEKAGIAFCGSKDHVIFEKSEVVKPDGKPYTVFTPYMRRWKETLNAFYTSSYPTGHYLGQLNQVAAPTTIPDLKTMGFSELQTVPFPEAAFPETLIEHYHETRDIPSLNGTSRLGLHLRFGTISIRQLVRLAATSNEKFLNELIWRDFYQMIIHHFPHSADRCFRPEYDRIRRENNMEHFEKWCDGKTGYPLVDAGMRELNATGYMHNRVRMVVASFLTKHLLIDWKLGERYFAEKLLDFELASNVGGWQWAAGSGCDAAPYFRVFNPESQQQKFDPNFDYIRKWIPELNTAFYPGPIVDHAFARERVLKRYKEGLGN
jgi:deoxyribodipyrimidine photo-lyase